MARFFRSPFGLLLLVVALLAAYALAASLLVLPEITSPPATALGEQPGTRCGALAARQRGDGEILFVPLAEIPKHLRLSLLAQEDRTFYAHGGADWAPLVRASIVNLTSGTYRFGAGTITMQLMRELFLGKQRTLLRKTREIAYALQAEKRLSKTEILELYLNVVHWGPDVRGVGAASCYYFGVPPAGLSASQSQRLVAVLKSPPRLGQVLRQQTSGSRRRPAPAP